MYPHDPQPSPGAEQVHSCWCGWPGELREVSTGQDTLWGPGEIDVMLSTYQAAIIINQHNWLMQEEGKNLSNYRCGNNLLKATLHITVFKHPFSTENEMTRTYDLNHYCLNTADSMSNSMMHQ